MQLFLDQRGAHSFDRFHPWVLERSIIQPTHPPQAGQVVEVLQPNGSWIGRGIFNPASRIRVRLYQWNQQQSLDQEWLRQMLDQAIAMRKIWMARHGALDAVRWVNSEGDGLSGLIVDQFGDYLVVHLTALATTLWQDWIVSHLSESLRPRGIFVKVDHATAKAEGIEAYELQVLGQPPEQPLVLHEGPVQVQVDLSLGQKTGYYLDQRTNRLKAAQWMSQGPMLDVCCYLGGFSLAAHAIARPVSIQAVDSSAKALEQARHNARLNQADINFVQADCFDYLVSLQQENKKFSTIVLDPPKMASHRSQHQSAIRAYHRLNLSAVNLLEAGGLLVTCSCSGRISRDDFLGVLASVSRRAKRSIQLIEYTGADFDHPVMSHCPETEYLKCAICRVA